LDTLALLDARNLEMTSDCQFDKEGRGNFREKAKKEEEQLFREKVSSFYKNKTKYLFRERWWLL